MYCICRYTGNYGRGRGVLPEELHPVLSEQGLHDSVVGRTCSFDGQTESAGIILVGRVEDWEGAG